MALMKINAPKSIYHGEVVQVLTMSTSLGLATVKYKDNAVVPIEIEFLENINQPTNRGDTDTKVSWGEIQNVWRPA